MNQDDGIGVLLKVTSRQSLGECKYMVAFMVSSLLLPHNLTLNYVSPADTEVRAGSRRSACVHLFFHFPVFILTVK